MIRTYKAEAIILSRKNIGEADKLITVFTKQYGKKTVIGKGIRRINSRRAPHLELFSRVIVNLHHGRSWDIITEVSPIEIFTILRKKLGRIGYAYIALELTDRLTAENQPDEFIYFKLLETLQMLNNSDIKQPDAKLKLEAYKHDLLSELGFITRDEFLDEDNLSQKIEAVLESELKSPKLLTNLVRSL